MASSGDSRALFSLAGSIFTRLVQIAQLPGLLDHSGDQHLRQDLIAGELGSEPAAALSGLTDEGGKVGQLSQRHFGDDGLQAVLVGSMPSTRRGAW